MTDYRWSVLKRSLALAAMLAVAGVPVAAQEGSPDLVQRALPNPNPEVSLNWAALPDGRTWGSTAGIDIDPTDGHVWVYDRCGGVGLAGGCAANPTVDPILKYDRNTGERLAAFGAGLFVLPHGLHVDDDGNVWVTDSQGNDEIGHQVFKFSPEGQVLMTLGVAGEPGSDPDGLYLNEPTDVITWGPTGDIFVSDGHSGDNPDPPPGRTGRILKYDQDGNFIKQWGEIGFRPGQFRTPHALEFDSQGRLFVADRGNNRIQIFDQDGELLDVHYQYSRPSGLYITAADILYVIDSESQETNHYGWMTGVRIGLAADDRVTAFIPPHIPEVGRTRQGVAGDGVVVDADGNVFVAEGPASAPFAGGSVTKYLVRNVLSPPPPLLYSSAFFRYTFPVIPTTRASRLFAGPRQYPPSEFAAYGIIAFQAGVTSHSRARYFAICEGFGAHLLASPNLETRGTPLAQQMPTIWPLNNGPLATLLNNIGPVPLTGHCNQIIDAIDVATSLTAIDNAQLADPRNRFNDDGPYMIAWSPSSAVGQDNVPVLVLDFSDVQLASHATELFRAWREEIQQNPESWRRGRLQLLVERLRRRIAEIANKYGPAAAP